MPRILQQISYGANVEGEEIYATAIRFLPEHQRRREILIRELGRHGVTYHEYEGELVIVDYALTTRSYNALLTTGELLPEKADPLLMGALDQEPKRKVASVVVSEDYL